MGCSLRDDSFKPGDEEKRSTVAVNPDLYDEIVGGTYASKTNKNHHEENTTTWGTYRNTGATRHLFLTLFLDGEAWICCISAVFDRAIIR
jgi:hypothetical protein